MIDVVTALESLASSLDWPRDDIDVTARAIAEIRRSAAPRRRRWPIAAAIGVAVIAVGVPAGAHLIDIGGVHIELRGGVAPDLGTELDLGAPTDVPDDFPLPRGIGDPAAAFEGRPPGAVTVVWAPSDELPEVLDTGVGLLLTRFPGRLDRELIGKRVYEGGTLESTTVGDAPAYWITGAPHGFFFVDDDGRVVQDRARLAGSALLWQRDGATYRLETSLSLERTVELAESMFD